MNPAIPQNKIKNLSCSLIQTNQTQKRLKYNAFPLKLSHMHPQTSNKLLYSSLIST